MREPDRASRGVNEPGGWVPRLGPRRIAPRVDRPLPLWMIFPLIFTSVYLSHLGLLRLPYYWDEAGYYIPAAYDFFRTGSLIPSTTLSNAHPPLPSIYLALWWKASGFIPAVTRTAMCFVAAMALLAVYRLALLLNGRPAVAIWTTFLTGLYPIWFAQSTLAHADMFAAAATLWALTFVLPPGPSVRRLWMAAICFALAALAKETAILTPLALALWESRLALKSAGIRRRHHALAALLLMLPIIPLLGWYAYHRARTGFAFGNPEYLRYNATATLTPLRVVIAFAHRLLHLTAHMNLFVPVMCTAAAMLLEPVQEAGNHVTGGKVPGELRPRVPFSSQAQIYFVLLANAVGFSVLGGALLTRYLLPMYPLILLICLSTLHRRVRAWHLLMLMSAAAFIAGIFVNPPYKFAPEDNLAYSDIIRLHQQAVRQVVTRFPNSIVLSAWPMTDELNKPELGYVKKPIKTTSIDNFSLGEIEKASLRPDTYSAAVVFSTKYDPPNLWLDLGRSSRQVDEKYFGYHQDLEPEAISHLLNGDIAWHRESKGQWAAVMHFDRAQMAALHPGAKCE